LSIILKIDVQKWLSTTSNLVIQRHNSWNNQYVTIIVMVTQRHNSWNSHCQFHEDTIHEIVNFSYRSCLQQPIYKLLQEKSNCKLPLQNLHGVWRQDGKPMHWCAQCSFLIENCKLVGDLSCKVAASTFLLKNNSYFKLDIAVFVNCPTN